MKDATILTKVKEAKAMIAHKFSIGDAMDFAESKVGIPGWKAVAWEDIGGDSIVEGSVPDGFYRSGPRKGKPRFTRPRTKVIVAKKELQVVATAYEAESGKCWDCKGSGQVWAGWSQAEGTRYQTCSRCKGTGDAVQQQQSEEA
jgi:hypothetical protein